MLEAGGSPPRLVAVPEGLKVLAPQVFPELVSCSHEHTCTRTSKMQHTAHGHVYTHVYTAQPAGT